MPNNFIQQSKHWWKVGVAEKCFLKLSSFTNWLGGLPSMLSMSDCNQDHCFFTASPLSPVDLTFEKTCKGFRKSAMPMLIHSKRILSQTRSLLHQQDVWHYVASCTHFGLWPENLSSNFYLSHQGCRVLAAITFLYPSWDFGVDMRIKWERNVSWL